MSIDLKVMRPGKLAGLLNSTRLGEVTSETRVRRNVIRAGLRVGDSTRVNVLGHAARLVAAWHARRGPGAASGLTGYDALRASAAARNRRLSAAGRDIAPLPDAANPEHRAACEKDFRRFCETYFPAAFCRAWSEDHLRVIAKIGEAVREGGLFAFAMPRGSGKTTLARMAALWAVLYGYPHRLRAIGHLFEAEDESQAWPDLHDTIRNARWAYQRAGRMPDFDALAATIAWHRHSVR